jgi:hypothetical protein
MNKLVSIKGENQMVFKRVLMPMLVMGIIFAMGSMAYAQTPSINCRIASVAAATATLTSLPGPTARATATGHTEPIGAGPDATALTVPAGGTVAAPVAGGGAVRVICSNITGGTVGPATAPAGFQFTTLAVGQISFGVTITNGTAFPAGAGIRILQANGALATATLTIGSDPVNRTGGTVTFQIPAVTWAAGETASFDLDGVLVSFNGSGKTRLDATLFIGGATGYATTCTAFGNTGTCNTAEVVTAVLPGLKDPTSPTTIPTTVGAAINAGTATFNLLGIGIKPTFVMRVEENYQDAFKTSTQFNGGATFPISGASNTEVQFQFSGIPAGLIIGGCNVVLTDQNGALITTATALVSAQSVTAIAPTLTVNFLGTMPLGTVDVLWLLCTTLTDPTDTSLPAAGVTAQASLAPAGTALSSTSGLNSSVTTGQIPRYQLSLQPTPGIVVVAFPPGAVSLLIPFATVGGGYNTGIAISNTTTDPFNAGGTSSVTPQNGTLTFTFYDNSGTVKTYTTSASSPGGGLAAGLLNSGKTYVVNLSELLTAAGITSGTFTGYIFITTNFTNAHGAAYVYNGAGFTSATPVLVVANRATPETLDQ